MSETTASGTRRWPRVMAWIGSLLVALAMTMPGISKVVNLEGRSLAGWDSRFQRWGLPGWLVPVVGASEVGGGALLLVPRMAPIGGLVVGVTMTGAMFTHLFNDQTKRAPIPLTIGLIATGVAVFRYRTNRPGTPPHS